MTGRELIIYILSNNLENEQVVKDGKLIGFESDMDFAARMEVGPETIRALAKMDKIKGCQLGNSLFIPKTITIMKDPYLK